MLLLDGDQTDFSTLLLIQVIEVCGAIMEKRAACPSQQSDDTHVRHCLLPVHRNRFTFITGTNVHVHQRFQLHYAL